MISCSRSSFNIIEYDSYAAFGPLEIVSALGLTINHGREKLPKNVVKSEHLEEFVKVIIVDLSYLDLSMLLPCKDLTFSNDPIWVTLIYWITSL